MNIEKDSLIKTIHFQNTLAPQSP